MLFAAFYVAYNRYMITVAAIQMVSSDQLEDNLQNAKNLIDDAVRKKAKFITLPENFSLMGKTDEARLAISEEYGEGKIRSFLSEQASSNQIWLLGGTIPLKSQDPLKVYAASLLFSPDGRCFAHYNKIHLFDVMVNEDDEEVYKESATFEAGTEPVVANTEIGNVGLSVCYDLRFPELYRGMLKDNIQLLTAPSAFTATTGEAHWEVLLRSRAIENLCYVIASNQGGIHANGRATWGHSMIVDPWGNILDCVECGPGIATATIDLKKQKHTRKLFPALKHRKLN